MAFCSSIRGGLAVGSNSSARIRAVIKRSVRSLLGASPSMAKEDLVSLVNR